MMDLAAFEARHDDPGSVVVRLRFRGGRPGHDEERERMIGFLVDAIARGSFARGARGLVHMGAEPVVLHEHEALHQVRRLLEHLAFLRAAFLHVAKVGDEVTNRVAGVAHWRGALSSQGRAEDSRRMTVWTVLPSIV